MDSLEAVDHEDAAAVSRSAEIHGYVWLRSLIEPALPNALAAVVEAAWREAPGDLPALHRAVLPTPQLDRIRRHPRLLSVLRGIVGEPRPEQGDVVRYVQPGDPPTPPHQDAQYVGIEPVLWSAWIPLGDCPLALGPLVVWPGSHRLGLLEHSAGGLSPDASARARWAAADFACGDVLLLHALTVHQALPNLQSHPRLSIDCRFAATT